MGPERIGVNAMSHEDFKGENERWDATTVGDLLPELFVAENWLTRCDGCGEELRCILLTGNEVVGYRCGGCWKAVVE